MKPARLFAASLVLSLAALGTPATLEPQGLKARWTFAEGSGTSAGDASGNNYTGTLSNGAAWTVGRIGTAVSLDGTNDYVSLGSNLSIVQNVPGATLATWVKLNAMPGSGVFRELISISVNSATSPTNVSRAALALVGDGAAADVFAGGRSTDTEAQQTLTAPNANLTANTWHHVAARLDFAGDTIEIYVNGVLSAQAAANFSAASTPDTPSTNAALGAQDSGDSNFLNGALDETTVYGRLLSAAEIQALADGQELRARWALDEGAGTTTADATPNNYDGTLRNGLAWTTGQMGGALSFDGVDDSVDLGGSLSMVRNVNAATVTAWIKPGSTIPAGSFRELVSISVNNPGGPTNTSRIALALRGDGTTAGDLYAGGRSTESEPQKNATADVNLAPGTWVHVAGVIDFGGKKITLYLNGNQVATAPADFAASHTPNTATTSAALGAQDTGDSNFYHGAMDDVRVYARPLCPCEIEFLALRDGLRARWPFDENAGTSAADTSGNNVTGTLANGAAWGAGQFGSAVSLDGVNDHVSLGTNLDILRKSNAATLATWVKLSSLPANGAFRELISISVNSATTPTNVSRAALAVKGDGTAADLFTGGRSTDTEAQQTLTADANLAANTWYHVAAVLDYGGNAIRLYLNGALVSSAAASFSQPATPDTASSNATLGAQDSGDSNFLHGLLDETRVYCRALSAAEIQDLALGAPPAAPTNLEATAGNGQITLNWTASAGATAYHIFRSLVSGTYLPTSITSVSATTFVDTGVVNGTEYFYVVKAINAAGLSGPSNEDSAIPTAGQVPAKPVLVTASRTTNDNTPTVVGTAEPNLAITVYFRQGATVVETLGTTSDIFGNWSVTASAKADGAYEVRAKATNAAGDSPESDPITIAIDTGVPTITSVTSTTSDGTYGEGASINITVNFSEPVTLTGGNLLVALNTGAVVAIAPFGPSASASGTYTVAAGQSAADLTAVSPLTLGAGAGLADAGGSAAGLAIPAGQNLGDLKNIVILTTTPAVTRVTSTTANGSYSVGAAISVTVEFSEPLTLAGGNLLVVLNSGATLSIPPFASAPAVTTVYTVQAGQNALDLTAQSPLGLSAGATLRNGVGTDAVRTIPAGQNLGELKDIVIDTLAPAVASVTSTSPNGAYGAGAPINVIVTFSEPVTLAGGNLLVALDTGAVVSIVPFGPLSSGTGTYVVAAGHNSADLTSTGLSLQSGALLRDVAGNAAGLAIPTGQNLGNLKNIVIDTAAPAVTSVSSTTADGTYGVGAAINITVNFSEPVTLTGGNLLIALNTGAMVSIGAFGPSATASGTYTVAGGQNSPDLSSTGLSLQGGATLRDAAGNSATLTIPAGQNIADLKDLLIDTNAPTVANVTSTTADGTYGVGAAINITVNFSEPVTLTGGNLLIALNTGATVSIGAFGPSATASGTYTVAAGQNTADLTSTGLSLQGGATLRDMAGNNASLTIPPVQNLGDLKNIVISTPPSTAPMPPTNVRTTVHYNTVDVEWDPSPSPNVAGYRVYRKEGQNGSFILLNTQGVVLNTKFRDSITLDPVNGAQNGRTYFYHVKAVGN